MHEHVGYYDKNNIGAVLLPERAQLFLYRKEVHGNCLI
jgi:hypothetical protein